MKPWGPHRLARSDPATGKRGAPDGDGMGDGLLFLWKQLIGIVHGFGHGPSQSQR